MSIFELIPLKRGGSGFLIGGFTFGLDKRRDDRSYLKCTEAKTRCKARATIFDGSNFAQINVESHNHLAPNTSQLQTYWSRKLGRSVYTGMSAIYFCSSLVQ